MKNNLQKYLWGGMLILFGSLWFAANFIPGFNIDWNLIWPLFVLLPGLFFLTRYLFSRQRRQEVGLLIPAGILVFLGLTFYFNILLTEVFMVQGSWAFTAFMYPGGVALAFWITWLASGREVGFLIPAVIMSLVSLLVFCLTASVSVLGGEATANINRVIWPLLIICIGFFVLLSPLWAGAAWKNSRFMGRTKKEWEDWGKEVGKSMDAWGNDFGKQVENAFEGKQRSQNAQDSQAKDGEGEIKEAELVEPETTENKNTDPETKS